MKNTAFYGLLLVCLVSSSTFGQGDSKRKGKGPQRAGGFNLERMFDSLDRNNDGKIDSDEAPERMKTNFKRMDLNQDGSLDKDEMKKVIARRMQNGGNAAKSRSGKNSDEATDTKRPGPQRSGAMGRGLDLAKMLKDGDSNGDGNLDPAEQKAIVARFNEMMSRFRQMQGKSKQKQKSNSPYNRPNTDPVKPKRPGK